MYAGKQLAGRSAGLWLPTQKQEPFLSGKDTVLVAVLCVLLHPLQVLLVTLQAPGVPFDLRGSVAVTVLQSMVKALHMLDLLHILVFLQLLDTALNREES